MIEMDEDEIFLQYLQMPARRNTSMHEEPIYADYYKQSD